MRKNEPITHLMSTDLITVHHGDPISRVREIFRTHDIHHLPVVSGKKLVGIISWTDLLRMSFGDAFGTDDKAVDATLDHTFSIEDLMTSEPQTLDENSSIRDAARALSEGDFHALPVVSGDELVGIVSTKDLIKYLVSLF